MVFSKNFQNLMTRSIWGDSPSSILEIDKLWQLHVTCFQSSERPKYFFCFFFLLEKLADFPAFPFELEKELFDHWMPLLAVFWSPANVPRRLTMTLELITVVFLAFSGDGWTIKRNRKKNTALPSFLPSFLLFSSLYWRYSKISADLSIW